MKQEIKIFEQLWYHVWLGKMRKNTPKLFQLFYYWFKQEPPVFSIPHPPSLAFVLDLRVYLVFCLWLLWYYCDSRKKRIKRSASFLTIEFESTKFRKSVCDIHMELILVNTALNRQVVHALVLMNRPALLSRSIQNHTGIA